MIRLPSWFRTARPTPRTRPTPCHKARLVLEHLEDRLVMSGTQLAYYGGPLIRNVEVETVFLGSAWQSDPQLAAEAKQIDRFFSYITNSSYMDMLSAYSVPGYTIGRGTFEGGLFDPVSLPANLTQGQVQQDLDGLIAAGYLARPDGNRLYFVFTPPGVTLYNSAGTSQYDSKNGFLGFHTYFTGAATQQVIPYALIPNTPIGSGTWGGIANELENLTTTSSHELAEAITDPYCGNGWLAGDVGHEIGDLAAGKFSTLNGWVVQDEWYNAFAGPAMPGGAVAGVQGSGIGTPSNLFALANSLTHSAEYYADFVTAAYEKYLGRTPDASGLAGWVYGMEHGLTDEQVEADFIGSAEYIASKGASPGNWAPWVESMYLDLLGRSPTQAEVNQWVAGLNAGISTTYVAYGFAASAERETLRVQADYQTYLGRSATSAEVQQWVSAFTRHLVTNEYVIAGFLGSAEYYTSRCDSDPTTWVDNIFAAALHRWPGSNEVDLWLGAMN